MPLNHPQALVDALLEQNEVAILLFDKSGLIIFANEVAKRLATGQSRGKALDKTLESEIWGKPYDFDGSPIPLNEWPPAVALRGVKSAGKEARMIRLDGTHYDISMSAAPLRTDEEGIIGAIMTFTDITQRRRDEQQRTAISARLEEIASERARGIHLMRLLGLSANSVTNIKEMFQIALTEICNQMGWSVGYAYILEAPGRPHGIAALYSSDPARYEALWQATAKLDLVSERNVIGRSLKQGRSVFVGNIDRDDFLRRDAARLAGLKSCLAIPVLVQNEPAAILEFFHTESIEPQDSVLEVMEVIGAHLGQVIEQKRNEQKLQVIFDFAPDAQIVTDSAGKIVMANRQTMRVFGYSPQELLGQSVEVLVPPDLRTTHIEHRAGYARSPRPRPMGIGAELRAVRKDQMEFPVEVSLSPIELDNTLLIASAIRDVTERKKLEQSMRERERLADIGTMAAIFAHEIGNPLASINIAAQEIKDTLFQRNTATCAIF